jgi:hypothetical protein
MENRKGMFSEKVKMEKGGKKIKMYIVNSLLLLKGFDMFFVHAVHSI